MFQKLNEDREIKYINITLKDVFSYPHFQTETTQDDGSSEDNKDLNGVSQTLFRLPTAIPEADVGTVPSLIPGYPS